MEASPKEARSLLSKWQIEGTRLYCLLAVDDIGTTVSLVSIAVLSDDRAVLGLVDSKNPDGSLLLSKADLKLSTVSMFDFTDESDAAFPVDIPSDLIAEGALKLTWSPTARCVLVALETVHHGGMDHRPTD